MLLVVVQGTGTTMIVIIYIALGAPTSTPPRHGAGTIYDFKGVEMAFYFIPLILYYSQHGLP
jgi:hypothetical protein